MSIDKVPVLPWDKMRDGIVRSVNDGDRIISLFGCPGGNAIRIYAVLSASDFGGFTVAASDVGERYDALTPECSQAHYFEREIAEQWGVRPEGHPWLKPVR
ncbi:MAG: NADH-quinone oxidoreductase subunit C, partial [Sulfuricella sp.]